jgi:AraC-like DNA-binding protein
VPAALDSAAPTFSLSRFIEDVRVLVPVAGRALDVQWLPDGRTTLVFRVLATGLSANLSVVGPRSRALFKTPTDVARAVTIRFRPGYSAPFLGGAASELSDRIVALEDIWGRPGSDLCRELVAATSLPLVMDRVAHALARRARPSFEPASGRLARRAVGLLEAGEARVENVAERLGVTARHLRRAFTDSVGIAPKEFARTVRLQRAVRGATLSNDWARIAADAGYYDQAHLIADFRQLVGLTPGAFMKRSSTRNIRPETASTAAA